MRITKFLIIISIMTLLLLAGCNNESEGQQSRSSKFIGGTEGLRIEFVDGTPPKEVLDSGQQFGATIKLSNQGEHTVLEGDAIVLLSGFSAGDFGVGANDLIKVAEDSLLGASRDAAGNKVQGAITTVDFPANQQSFEYQKRIAGSISYNIKADVCYPYTSYANSQICVLRDILGTTGQRDPLCVINERKTVDMSGAPVHIENFVQSVSSSDKVSFVFTIRHKGRGSVYQYNSACEEDFNTRNKVRISVDTGITDGSLTCSGLQNSGTTGTAFEGDVVLLNGEREIRCTQQLNNPSDFEQLVQIRAMYDYRDSVTTSLAVKNLGIN